MQTTVLLFSIAVALFCIGALSKYGKADDAYRRRKESLRDTKRPVRDEVLNKPIKERIIPPFIQGLTRFTANAKSKSNTKSPSYLQNERLLRQAGLSITPEGYRYFRILLTGVLVGWLPLPVLSWEGLFRGSFMDPDWYPIECFASQLLCQVTGKASTSADES